MIYKCANCDACVNGDREAGGAMPIGWGRASITLFIRVPCDKPDKIEMQSKSKQFYFCQKCHLDWWKE